MSRRLFGATPPLSLQRERWGTPDNDFLDLDFFEPHPAAIRSEAFPTVLLLHGLEGSSRAKYILGMFEKIHSNGWRGIALNFRSCSGEINRQKRFYHSGETGDLDWVVRRLIERYPESPLFLIGFSLGGNVLLKWMGERGKNVPTQILAAVAISVPFDLAIAARSLDRGISRIYGYVFLKTLKPKAIVKAEQYPGIIDVKRVSRIKSFAEFDDHVTAPFHGFKNALDYWTKSSSKHFLSDIQTPTLLINAGNDPFLPATYIPEEAAKQSKWLVGEFPRSGGHVGFVEGNWPLSPTYWIESRAVAFLEHHISLG